MTVALHNLEVLQKMMAREKKLHRIVPSFIALRQEKKKVCKLLKSLHELK